MHFPYLSRAPQFASAVFVAANATIVGSVSLGLNSSVFYGAVLRGDINEITIGDRTNIQDNVIVHVADAHAASIGAKCTIGHAAIVHGATIEDECLIGMAATVLDGARIGTQSLVAANSLVLQNFSCPPGSLVMGSPARVARVLTSSEREALQEMAEKYVLVASAHAKLSKAPR